MKIYTFRLKSGDDLVTEIVRFTNDNNIKAGFIITCVASLKYVTMRMAGAKPNNQDIRTVKGPLEVVSLVGTISVNGCHLHIGVSNKEGKVIGGHLKEGSLVETTAEVVIGEDSGKIYSRIVDKSTGFKELVVTDERKS